MLGTSTVPRVLAAPAFIGGNQRLNLRDNRLIHPVFHDGGQQPGRNLVFGLALGIYRGANDTNGASVEHPKFLAIVDLFKLDIEGSEEAALRGAEETLRRDKPYVICSYEHDSNDLPAIVGFMAGLGYQAGADDERWKTLTFQP